MIIIAAVDIKQAKQVLKWKLTDRMSELKKGVKRADENRDYKTKKRLMLDYNKLKREADRL